jgi:hypothetical protein
MAVVPLATSVLTTLMEVIVLPDNAADTAAEVAWPGGMVNIVVSLPSGVLEAEAVDPDISENGVTTLEGTEGTEDTGVELGGLGMLLICEFVAELDAVVVVGTLVGD